MARLPPRRAAPRRWKGKSLMCGVRLLKLAAVELIVSEKRCGMRAETLFWEEFWREVQQLSNPLKIKNNQKFLGKFLTVFLGHEHEHIRTTGENVGIIFILCCSPFLEVSLNTTVSSLVYFIKDRRSFKHQTARQMITAELCSETGVAYGNIGAPVRTFLFEITSCIPSFHPTGLCSLRPRLVYFLRP